ncbi:MAG: carboxypeptidase regulatory-like domain-containing protein [Gemmatimonadaceae bacterium]|nr:carboxypeptidase regulatory-like domain-containing protein [Gemmatimonadaceae bacterium]
MLALCASIALTPATGGAQVRNPRKISVTVTDTAGNPISSAEVAVNGTNLKSSTNLRGEVEFVDVDWGPQKISVRKIGFREASQDIVVPAGGSVATSILLSRLAVNLSSVMVRDSGGKPPRLARTTRFDDFYRRRKAGEGTFITREDIERRGPSRAFDLFASIAGLRLTYRGNTPLLSFARCKSGVEVFIDGQRLNDGMNELAAIHPNQIEAIEVYHGLASVPPQFSPKPDDCAAIVIWTRFN